MPTGSAPTDEEQATDGAQHSNDEQADPRPSQTRRDPSPSRSLRHLSHQLEEARLRRAIGKLQGESNALLLALFDALAVLMEIARGRVQAERFFANCAGCEGEPGFKEWVALAHEIAEIHRHVERMVTQLNPDLSDLPHLYLKMRRVRSTWERHRRWRAPVDVPESREDRAEGESVIRRELAAIDTVLGLLRQFLGDSAAP